MNKPIFLSLSGRILAVCLATAVVLSAAQAQQAGTIELKNIAEVEMETKDAQGKIERKRVPVATAVPGTEVIYTTTFKNISTRPAANIVINNPVPANTTLVAGSVYGANTDISYSVDGKTFATPDKLRVKGKDGKEVAATAADYAAIRWSYKGDLPPGKAEVAGFRAVIN